jgi:hypothetical protein
MMSAVAMIPSERQQAESAVTLLQRGAQSGRPVLIPGALEPRRSPPERIVEPMGPRGPLFDPTLPGGGIWKEREPDEGRAPAARTLLDRIQQVGLRTVEGLIRLLATPR